MKLFYLLNTKEINTEYKWKYYPEELSSAKNIINEVFSKAKLCIHNNHIVGNMIIAAFEIKDFVILTRVFLTNEFDYHGRPIYMLEGLASNNTMLFNAILPCIIEHYFYRKKNQVSFSASKVGRNCVELNVDKLISKNLSSQDNLMQYLLDRKPSQISFITYPLVGLDIEFLNTITEGKISSTAYNTINVVSGTSLIDNKISEQVSTSINENISQIICNQSAKINAQNIYMYDRASINWQSQSWFQSLVLGRGQLVVIDTKSKVIYKSALSCDREPSSESYKKAYMELLSTMETMGWLVQNSNKPNELYRSRIDNINRKNIDRDSIN